MASKTARKRQGLVSAVCESNEPCKRARTSQYTPTSPPNRKGEGNGEGEGEEDHHPSTQALPSTNSTVRRVLAITELLEKILLACDQETLLTTACRVSKHWHSVIQTSVSIQQALFFLPIRASPGKPTLKPVKNPILEKHFAHLFSLRKTPPCHHMHGFQDLDFYPMFDVRYPHVKVVNADPNAENMTGTSVNPIDVDLLYNDEDGVLEDIGAMAALNEVLGANGAAVPTGHADPNIDLTTNLQSAGAGVSRPGCPPKWKMAIEWPDADNLKMEKYLQKGASWRRMLVRQPPMQRLAYCERTHVNVNYLAHPYYDYYKATVDYPVVSKPAEKSTAGPMSITTLPITATGGVRMDALYDVIQLNLSRTSIQDPNDDDEDTFLDSTFHVYWDGAPSTNQCPDNLLRKQMKKLVGKGKSKSDTIVVQITAAERPLSFMCLAAPHLTDSFGRHFRSLEAVGDPHHLHKKGVHVITGPSWLKKKWVADRIDGEALLLHWHDLLGHSLIGDGPGEDDDVDGFDPFLDDGPDGPFGGDLGDLEDWFDIDFAGWDEAILDMV